MLKNILKVLVLVGIVPVIIVEATAEESNHKNNLATTAKAIPANFDPLCSEPNSWAHCNSFSDNRVTEMAEFNLSNLAQLLLSRKINLNCLEKSPDQIWQSHKNRLNSSVNSAKCIFAWQNKFSQKPVVDKQFINSAKPSSPQPSAPKTAKPKMNRDSAILSQFPRLSRSSLIVSIPQPNQSSGLKLEKFVNPAPATERIASPFGWRSRPYSNQLQFHQGIDYGAPLGSPVVAAGNGIVTKVSSGCTDFGNLFCGGQLGNWIEIDHGKGVIATYGHLKNSSIAIKLGTKVQKNQQIAQVGSSGWSTGAHLDFRLKVNGEYDNPAKYVASNKLKQAKNKSNQSF